MSDFLKMIADKRDKPKGCYSRAGNAESNSEPEVGNLLLFRNLRGRRPTIHTTEVSVEIFAHFRHILSLAWLASNSSPAIGRNSPWHLRHPSALVGYTRHPRVTLNVPRQNLKERQQATHADDTTKTSGPTIFSLMIVLPATTGQRGQYLSAHTTCLPPSFSSNFPIP